jgi:membrane protein
MTERSPPDERAPDDPRRGGWTDRLKRLPGRVLEFWVVRRVRAVMEAANAAGGPLLASALAFSTMFAIIPGLLLLSGVLGWVIDDPVIRADLVARLVAYVPPLADAVADSLEGVVRTRGALSLIGLVGLIWGASNFYAALDEVMRRLFPGGGVRGFVERRVRGAIAVTVLVLLVVGTIALGGLWGALETMVGIELVALVRVTAPLISLPVMVLVVFLVYRFVPTAPPPWRAALPPAIVAGIAIGLLTNLFGLLAPLVVGGLAGFGVLAAVFGAFIWLNFCFQVLIYGAAWARYRRDRMRLTAD